MDPAIALYVALGVALGVFGMGGFGLAGYVLLREQSRCIDRHATGRSRQCLN
jgi:hypothetical protein